MKKRNLKNKIISGALALCMIVGLLPLSAFAEDTAPVNSETIAAVTPPAVTQQDITVGSEDTLALPSDTLSATLTTITWAEVPVQTPEGETPKTEWQSTTTTTEIPVSVQWTLPEGETFSAAEVKTFTYTAKLTDETYTVANEVVMPTFTANVVAQQNTPQAAPPAPIQKTISAFVEPEVIEIPLGDIRSEADIVATFPSVVLATVDGVPNTEVPVTAWELVYAGTTSGAFSAEEKAEIFYEPSLALGYTLSPETILPSQKVQIGEALVHEPAPAVGTGAESFSFEVTIPTDGTTFRIPLSGGTGTNKETAGNYGKPYNWSIDWDSNGSVDQTISNGDWEAPQNNLDSDGIPHTYKTAGTYEITITNNMLKADGTTANNDAWLAAFGFYSTSYSGDANDSANKAMVTAITSQITPLMTRSEADLASATPIHNEWESAFYGCTNLKDIGPGFSSVGWANITAVGHDFAQDMFKGCTSITSIPDTFTLPVSDKVTTVGDDYAFQMFNGCINLETVGSGFTLLQSPVLTTIGSGMGSSLFSGCTKLTEMGTNFNTPQSEVLTTIGSIFGSGMFSNCSSLKNMGNSFLLPSSNVLSDPGENFGQNMFGGCTSLEEIKPGFTLPQSSALTNIPTRFANSMFKGCTSLKGIPSTFQVPQSNIITIGDSFLGYMFQGCTGLTTTGTFTLPQVNTIESIGKDFVNYMFAGCTSLDTIGDSFNMPQSSALESIGVSFGSSMFSGCENLTSLGTGFTMPQSKVLKTVADQFAMNMFNGCKKLQNIGNVLNLPQSPELTTTGSFFASGMFQNCTSLSDLGTAFNFPQSEKLTTVGYRFADDMFNGCTSLQTLGETLNMPQSPVLENIESNFAANMFFGCTGLQTLGDTFTLPQSQVIATIESNFAHNMFSGCSSLESLGANFNLPTSPLLEKGNAGAVGMGFAYQMFADVGKSLVINDVFKFTKLSQEQLDNVTQFGDPSFGNVFATANLAPNQSRTAESIINGNGIPSSQRNTFSNQSAAFSDWNIMPLNWGGAGMHTVTYQNNTTQNITPSSVPPQGQIADGQPATRPADAQADGYVLENWYADNTLTTVYNFSAPVNANVTVYAGWGINIRYETNGGTVIADNVALVQRPLAVPTAPTRVGFTFDGWYTDAALQTPYDFAVPVTEDVTLYANWTENVTSSSSSSSASSSSSSSSASSSSSSSASTNSSSTSTGITTVLSPQTGVYA